MAGYWSSSFFACLWTEIHLDLTSWSKTDLLFLAGHSWQDGAILSTRVANHSAGFGSCCALTELTILNIYTFIIHEIFSLACDWSKYVT